MLTSKRADAKSALCKWTAGTHEKNPSPEPRTIQWYSQYTDITWNRLNLEALREDVWVHEHSNFKWTNSDRNYIRLLNDDRNSHTGFCWFRNANTD